MENELYLRGLLGCELAKSVYVLCGLAMQKYIAAPPANVWQKGCCCCCCVLCSVENFHAQRNPFRNLYVNIKVFFFHPESEEVCVVDVVNPLYSASD